MSDNEILLLVKSYLKIDGSREGLTYFGELCKWNLVKPNSPRAPLSLSRLSVLIPYPPSTRVPSFTPAAVSPAEDKV